MTKLMTDIEDELGPGRPADIRAVVPAGRQLIVTVTVGGQQRRIAWSPARDAPGLAVIRVDVGEASAVASFDPPKEELL